MSTMKYNTLMMMMLAMGMMGSSMMPQSQFEALSDEEKQAFNDRMKKKYRLTLLKRGVKEFTIDGITVLAINEKNAQRKVNNIKSKLR